jgi:hypothetical protein
MLVISCLTGCDAGNVKVRDGLGHLLHTGDADLLIVLIRLRRTMEMQRAVTLLFAIALIAIVIVGFVNFDLFLLLWVKAVIAALFVGAFVEIMKPVFRSK